MHDVIIIKLKPKYLKHYFINFCEYISLSQIWKKLYNDVYRAYVSYMKINISKLNTTEIQN